MTNQRLLTGETERTDAERAARRERQTERINMSVDRGMQFGDQGCYIWDFSCDGERCCAEFAAEGVFQEAIEAMRDKGWIGRKVDGEWLHYCPNCKDKMTKGSTC